METDDLVARLLAGERRALARALTRVEDGTPEQLRGLIAAIHPATGSAQLVGITGSPGVGKSTLTGVLVAAWRRQGRRVAVLAIDPSSPFSGGALLGDRVRMQDHVLDDGVYIRSMASRGHLGGLSWATPQALLVLDAAGFDVVVVETVGVGQAEVEIAAVADTTVVVLAPGMGDAIQAAKAGILEVADVLCVNKADRDGAERAVRDLREMQQLSQPHEQRGATAGATPVEGWTPPIQRTVAARAEGVDELRDAIDDHRRWLGEAGVLERRRLQRAGMQLRELALGAVRQRLLDAGDGQAVDRLAGRVAARELDPYSAADELLVSLGG